MKRTFKYALIVTLCLLAAAACTSGFEEANTNPNEPDTTDPEYLFNSSSYYTLVSFNGEIKKRLLGNYAQYHWGVSDQMGRYGNFPSSNDGYWRNCYNNAAFPVRYIRDQKGGDPRYRNRVLIAHIWENYIFSQIVAIWGGVPMTNAMKATQSVPYDREETIYYNLLESLKKCAEALDEGGDRYKVDPVFPAPDKASDIAGWRKFANSLRFRLAMRISNDAPNGNPQKAREVVAELFEDESAMISSPDEECTLSWGDTPQTRNYFYDYLIMEREANKDRLNTAGESILQHMFPYRDPRVPKFFTEANQLQIPPAFAWTPYWGQPKTTQTPPGVSINPNPHSGKTSTDYSLVAESFFDMSYTEMLFGYAEMCLLKCEAVYRGLGEGGKTAEEYYYDGIRASMTRFGVSPAEADAYMEVPGVKWNTFTDLTGGEAKFMDWTGVTSSAIKPTEPDPVYRQIVTQQYVALFYQSLEAWNLIRRTQVLEFPPHFNPDTGNGAVTAQGKNLSYIPQRLMYPDNEKNNNRVEAAKASEWLVGGDKMDSKLWFAKPAKINPYF